MEKLTREKLKDVFKLVHFKEDEYIKKVEELSINNIHPHYKRTAVLGLDIYKYSEYEENKQNLIPFIFDIILDETIKSLEPSGDLYLFKSDLENIRNNFISTGDGGYLFFKTPFHALIFNMHFYSVLHMFNTGHFYPNLLKYVGNLIIRSAITFDNIFEYEGKFYGKAIIDNSRILSKDRLNRLIIDNNVFDYFNINFNGIESLPLVVVETIEKIMNEKYEKMTFFCKKDFYNKYNNPIGSPIIRNIHIQKIEDLLSKNTKLKLYNIEIQYSAAWYDSSDETKKTEIFILTIGNLNTNSLN